MSENINPESVRGLVAYLRRQGEQCNRQQPIVPVAGSELLKSADALEAQERAYLALSERVTLAFAAFDNGGSAEDVIAALSHKGMDHG